MKTVKLVLITAFVSFTMMSFSSVKYEPGIAGVNVVLETAMMNPPLLAVMFHQVNEDMIEGEQRGYYVARVLYQGKTFYIHADLEGW